MNQLKQDARHLLLGMSVTLIVVAAIVTLCGTLYVFLVALATLQGEIFRRLVIPNFAANLLVAAIAQMVMWYYIRRLQIFSPRTAKFIQWLMIATLPLLVISLALTV